MLPTIRDIFNFWTQFQRAVRTKPQEGGLNTSTPFPILLPADFFRVAGTTYVLLGMGYRAAVLGKVVLAPPLSRPLQPGYEPLPGLPYQPVSN